MSHCKKVKLLYVGNECTDSSCRYCSYEKKWTFLEMKICEVYIWKKKCNKISLISSCASILSDGFSASLTPWHIFKLSALHMCCKPSTFLSKKSQKTVLLRRSHHTSSMVVTSLLHKALHLTHVSLLDWSNKDIARILMLECSIKMKVVILSTPITLFGTVPLGQICEMTLPRPSMLLCQDILWPDRGRGKMK